MMTLFDPKKNRHVHSSRMFSRGFSLLEMLVVIAILGVMTSIIIGNRQRFNESVTVTNLAYDVALSIRESQVYGIAVQGFDIGGAISFDYGYGVYFQEPDADDPILTYTLFLDRGPYDDGSGNIVHGVGAPDQMFDPADDIVISNYTLNEGYSLEVCVHDATVADPSSYDFCTGAIPAEIEAAAVTFVRPDPDAKFLYYEEGLGWIGAASFDKLRVRVFAPDPSNFRDIIVYSNGQVAVCGGVGC